MGPTRLQRSDTSSTSSAAVSAAPLAPGWFIDGLAFAARRWWGRQGFAPGWTRSLLPIEPWQPSRAG